jgi:hypothetical protein
VKTLIKVLAVLCLLVVSCFGQSNYGSYRDSGAGIFSNQGWCNEVTAGSGATTGCAPDILSTAYTTTAQATANVATEQNVVSVPLPAAAILKAGKTLIVKGAGTYSLGAASTVTLKVKVCTVSGCGSGTVVTPCTWVTGSNANTSVTSSFNFECTIGTSTSATTLSKVLGHGILGIEVGATNVAALTMFGDATTAESATIDLTAADFLQTSVTFGTANASNTLTQQESVVILSN